MYIHGFKHSDANTTQAHKRILLVKEKLGPEYWTICGFYELVVCPVIVIVYEVSGVLYCGIYVDIMLVV